jgi:hypothetical protein
MRCLLCEDCGWVCESHPSPKTVHQILDSRAALIEYRPWIKEVDEASRRRWKADGTYARSDAVAGIIKLD